MQQSTPDNLLQSCTEVPQAETEAVKNKIVEDMNVAGSHTDFSFSSDTIMTTSHSILPPAYSIETKLCKALIKCTGYNKDIKELDELRKCLKMKKQQKHDKQLYGDVKYYRHLLVKVKRSNVLIHSEHQKAINKYEKGSFAKTGRIPSKDEEIWLTLVRTKNYASKLLQMWDEDISLFLYKLFLKEKYRTLMAC